MEGMEMTYMARLVTITKVSSVTDALMPFINFQANQKGVVVTNDTKVVVLQVENIPSYHVVFPETGITIEELEEELAKSETVLTPDTRGLLRDHLKSDK
jgi:hypothetical protein